MDLTVEEALRRIQEQAAVVRFLAECAAQSPYRPDESVFNGLSDVCAEIEGLARTRQSLVSDVLNIRLRTVRAAPTPLQKRPRAESE